MTQTPLTTQDAESSIPLKMDITSNSTGQTQSAVNGFVNLRYYESITLDSPLSPLFPSV